MKEKGKTLCKNPYLILEKGIHTRLGDRKHARNEKMKRETKEYGTKESSSYGFMKIARCENSDFNF